MIIGFGFNHGAPKAADHIFDVRQLTHASDSPEFASKKQEIIDYCRLHPAETVAIGCRQGKHRAPMLARHVASAMRTSLYLRDVGRPRE